MTKNCLPIIQALKNADGDRLTTKEIGRRTGLKTQQVHESIRKMMKHDSCVIKDGGIIVIDKHCQRTYYIDPDFEPTNNSSFFKHSVTHRVTNSVTAGSFAGAPYAIGYRW